MRCLVFLACSAALSVALLGCNKADPAAPAAPAGDSPAQASADAASGESAAAHADGPEGAVYQFLEAVRTGNDIKTEAMFTATARDKLKELRDIQVAPPGSDTAKFEIGEVTKLGEDGARVACKWTDLGKDGQPRTDEIVWMVRKEPEGWRIAGMAATVFEGEDPLLLDFENPQETLQKLEMLRAEIQRRMEKPAEQAQQPETPDEGIRR